FRQHGSSTALPARPSGSSGAGRRDRQDFAAIAHEGSPDPGRVGGAQEHLRRRMSRDDPGHVPSARFGGPPSRLAVRARRVAVFSLVVAALAIMIERVDLLEIVPVLVTFGAALGLSVLAILLALASFVSLWKHGGSGFAQAVTAALIGAGLLAYPGYLAYVGHG